MNTHLETLAMPGNPCRDCRDCRDCRHHSYVVVDWSKLSSKPVVTVVTVDTVVIVETVVTVGTVVIIETSIVTVETVVTVVTVEIVVTSHHNFSAKCHIPRKEGGKKSHLSQLSVQEKQK